MVTLYYRGQYPKKKRQPLPGEFPNRRAALAWCRNHRYMYEGLTLVFEDGTEEQYVYK